MPFKVASLVCHAHVDMALACLGTLLTHSVEPLHLRIHDDGSLTATDRDRLMQGLPGSVIVLAKEAEDTVLPLLARYPECLAFRARSVLARKLLDVPLLSTGEFAFCDSDVWWFRPFEGLSQSLQPAVQAVFMKDNQEAYSLRPWDLIGPRAVRVPSRVNTGLILARTSILDLDFLEWLLGLKLPAFSRFPLWAEQTCWAALGQRAGCRLWDPQQVQVIQDAGCLGQPLTAGHFTSEVRSLMPSRHTRQVGNDDGQPLKLGTIEARALGALGLGWSQIKRFGRTRFGLG
jgi:hypothetical protein